MQVFEVMTPDVVSIAEDATLVEAARTMRYLDIGPLPVCAGTRLLGMVTDRDITVRSTAEGRDPKSTLVRDVMTTEVVSCHASDEVHTAAAIMQKAQLRRLLVLDDEGLLVGIVSLGDLILKTGDELLAGETLEKVSEPSGSRC